MISGTIFIVYVASLQLKEKTVLNALNQITDSVYNWHYKAVLNDTHVFHIL